jgi:hypothetical protein
MGAGAAFADQAHRFAPRIEKMFSNSKEPLIKFDNSTDFPSGAKAPAHFAVFAARLKPCPFKTST